MVFIYQDFSIFRMNFFRVYQLGNYFFDSIRQYIRVRLYYAFQSNSSFRSLLAFIRHNAIRASSMYTSAKCQQNKAISAIILAIFVLHDQDLRTNRIIQVQFKAKENYRDDNNTEIRSVWMMSLSIRVVCLHRYTL